MIFNYTNKLADAAEGALPCWGEVLCGLNKFYQCQKLSLCIERMISYTENNFTIIMKSNVPTCCRLCKGYDMSNKKKFLEPDRSAISWSVYRSSRTVGGKMAKTSDMRVLKMAKVIGSSAFQLADFKSQIKKILY